MKLQAVLQKEFNDEMSSVTFWDEAKGAAPGGTFATILHALSDDAIQVPRSDFNPCFVCQTAPKVNTIVVPRCRMF